MEGVDDWAGGQDQEEEGGAGRPGGRGGSWLVISPIMIYAYYDCNFTLPLALTGQGVHHSNFF